MTGHGAWRLLPWGPDPSFDWPDLLRVYLPPMAGASVTLAIAVVVVCTRIGCV